MMFNYDENQKPSIRRADAFCEILSGQLIPDGEAYGEVLNRFDHEIKQVEPDVTQGALNNCHGDWYEWMLAISAWNYRIANNRRRLLLLLPNIRGFDLAALYSESLFGYITDLRQKVVEHSDVQLITSNPDFVIIDPEGMDENSVFDRPITDITPRTIELLEGAYEYFKGACRLDNIVGYLSVKTSFRPDRRLQLSHEGSLMKATYVHLQTRDWIMNPKGLKYYGAATAVSDADLQGLRTVATHSITNVQSEPQAAVDEVFTINSNEDANGAYEVILSE